jgi:predicted ATPase
MELVSRQDQLARLEDNLQRALRSQMQIALITGEAGIGKTVLLDEFISRSQRLHPELFVARSKCYEVAGIGQEPYAPFVQLLDEIVNGKKSSITWDRLRVSLVELAPDWLQHLPGGNLGAAIIRSAGEKIESADKQRRMVQFVNAMRLASHNSPVLLAIDDIHWSDQASIELLSFMTEQLLMSPIMLVLLFRPGSITQRVQGESHPIRRMVTQFKRIGRCTELELPYFTQIDVHELVSSLNYRFSVSFIERLWQQSNGNPMFIREFLTLLHTRALIQREQGYLTLSVDPETVDIPTSTKAIIQQRLEYIATDLRQLLSHASVQGERFVSQVLAGTVNDIPESSIMKYLNQLEDDYRLVSELEDQRLVVKVGPEYRFVHALLQQVLYQELSEGQRRLLHQVIARLLESLYGEEASRHSVTLANHYELGGNLPRAINYYFQACQNAIAVQALDDALELAHKTQDLARRIQTTDRRAPQWLIQSLLQEAEIHFWRADYRSGLTVTAEGSQLCEQYGLTELNANFLYWESRVQRALGLAGESVILARKALQILGSDTNPRLRGLLHAYLGSVSDSLPVDELNRHLTEALYIAENNSLVDVKVKALLEMAGLAIFRTDRPSETLNYARQAVKIAAANNMFIEQVTACRQEAFACLRMGKFDEALALDQQAVELARKHDLPVALHLALFSLSVSLSSGMDNPTQGLEALHESLEIARQYTFRPSRNVYGQLFNITFALGRWEEASAAQKKFYEAISNSYQRGLGYHLRMKGHEFFALGQYEMAVDTYRSAIDMYRKYSPDGRDMHTVEPYLGLALVEAGDDLAARPILEEACDFWKGRQSSRYARGLCALATLHLKRGDCDQAIPLLRQALTAVEYSASDQPWPVRAQVSFVLGRALLMNGDKQEALIHAQWAYDRYKYMSHFLTGDAAYWLAQVYKEQNKTDLANASLVEARQKWTDLGLEHRLKLLA